MARVLGCDEQFEDFDHDCSCKKHHHHHDHCDHKCRCRIRIGRVTVDCTPVTFRTCGQAFNVVSCPFTQVTSETVEQTVLVPTATQCVASVPVVTSCLASVPVTQLTQVPVISTFNLPPVISPTTVTPFFTGQTMIM